MSVVLLTWIFHKLALYPFPAWGQPLGGRTGEDFCVLVPLREERREAKGEKRSHTGRPTSPRSRHDDSASPAAAVLRGLSSPARTRRALGTRHAPEQDGCPTGRGTADSKAVTRCRRACTGQALGRGRRRRSVSCLTCAAMVPRGRLLVEGWACARAGWWTVEVRKAWWRTSAAHARRNRSACARQGGAAGRARRRALCTALLSVSPWPRAPESASDRLAGVGASNDGTPTRGGAPARLPSAWSPPRPGWAQAPAAAGHASESRRLGGGAWPWAGAHAPRWCWRCRAAALVGAAWRRPPAWLARPQTTAVQREEAMTSLPAGVAQGLSPRTRRGGWGQWRRREDPSRTTLSALAAPGGRVPGRRGAAPSAGDVPAQRQRGSEPWC